MIILFTFKELFNLYYKISFEPQHKINEVFIEFI
jgi:hypothetical protein